MKKLLLYITFSLLLPGFIIANDCDNIMDNERANIVIEQIKRKSNDSLKMNIIKTYLQRLCINTGQMLAIMDVFESEEMKTQFFIYSKEYITDIKNYNKLISN
tara:strand:+ start:517 stop:825 length:309 start_codon:yes stop_codon:yes gene_type:complete